MREGLAITSATSADAAEIAALYAHHVLHGVATFEIVPPDAEAMARRIRSRLDAGHPWLVARDAGGTMLGYAYAGRFHPREAYRFTCEDSIYLAHDRLGRGIGAALLAALIEAAQAVGFRQMIAQIVVLPEGGEGASIPLHRRFGFTEAGRTRAVGRKFGRWLDVITMQRALGPGDGAPPAKEP
ncbi:MAG: GNAT family N-acetyltransferase [Novosphingobium sp.]